MPTKMVACALALFLPFGCTGTDIFIVNVEGFVLEYVDDTRTTTRPVADAWVEVILPDGQTQEICADSNPPGCFDLQWVAETSTDSDGHYILSIFDRDHCALRVRAYGDAVGAFPPVPDTTSKTATAPRLAESCEHLVPQEGPTLIIE